MSLGEMHACLARLYVDASFRKLFHLDRAATVAEYRLSVEERAALLALDRGPLDYFAGALANKRKKRMELAYPLSFDLAAPEAEHYFARYHQLYILKPRQTVHHDVQEFGRFLEESCADAPALPPYAADLVRYERLYYGVMFTDVAAGGAAGELHPGSRPRLAGGVRVGHFGYDLVAIEKAVQGGGRPDESHDATSPCSIVFRPAVGGDGRRMFRVNDATAAVLELCDGERTLAGVVAATETRLGGAPLTRGITDAVERLISLGVLVTTPATGPATSWATPDASHYHESL